MNTPASPTLPGQQPLQRTQSAAAPSDNSPGGNLWKEVIAALLAFAIVGVTVIFLMKMFWAPADVSDALWQHQSAMLQAALGLAGTVTGYYYGRIPAERAAANAHQAANNAQQNLAGTTAVAHQAQTSEQRIRDRVNDLRRQISTTPLGGGEAGVDAALRTQFMDRLDDILRG
jgi:hypothetical protein